MKKLLFLLICCSGLAAQTIAGFWKSIDDETGKPRCVVAVYEYKDLYYGRMIATFDDDGKVKESDMKRMFIHSIRTDELMAEHSVSSKLNTDWKFLTHLRDEGRKVAKSWLDENFQNIGNQSSIDIRKEFL